MGSNESDQLSEKNTVEAKKYLSRLDGASYFRAGNFLALQLR